MTHKKYGAHSHRVNSLVNGNRNQSVKYVLSSYSVFCTYFVPTYSGECQRNIIQ